MQQTTGEQTNNIIVERYIHDWADILDTKITHVHYTKALHYTMQCYPAVNTIQISTVFLKYLDRMALRYVTLHEVAHQKVYDKWGDLVFSHGFIWKRLMAKHYPNWKEMEDYINDLLIDADPLLAGFQYILAQHC